MLFMIYGAHCAPNQILGMMTFQHECLLKIEKWRNPEGDCIA